MTVEQARRPLRHSRLRTRNHPARVTHPAPTLLVCALALGATVAAPAQGGKISATRHGDQAPSLPAITVTDNVSGDIPTKSRVGTKTDTPLMQTAQSISTVSKNQIESQGAKTVGQALRYVSGVVAEWRGLSSGSYDHIMVRGSAGYSVDRYWDGLKLPGIGTIGGPNPDPYLLERVEVLKGPASTLYGQGPANGLVNLVSKMPPAEPLHEARASLGGHDYRETAFDLGGPVGEGQAWFYRLTGVGQDSGSPVHFARQKRIALAPALAWRPDADTTLTLLASHQHDPDLGYYDTRPVLGTARANPLGKVPRHFSAGEPDFNASNRKSTTVGYQFEHRFNETWTVRQNLRYVSADYAWQAVAFQSLRPDYRTANRYASRLVRTGHAVALDNQSQSAFRTGPLVHTLLAGLDYQRENARSTNYAGMAAPLDIRAPVYGGRVNLGTAPRGDAGQVIASIGTYLQDQITLGRLSALVGGRHDHVSTTSTDHLKSTATRQVDNASTWRTGFMYELGHGMAPYLGYSESFQPVGGFDASGNAFKPARGKQVELGVKIQPAGSNALFTLAAFDLKEDNLTAPDDSHIGFSAQFGQVRTRGIELEGKYAANRSLGLTIAYTYLDSEITRGSAAQVGKRRPNVPRHTASAWVDYVFGADKLNGLAVGVGVRYVGTSPANTADAPNRFDAPAYTLADLALHYDLGAASTALRGANLDLNIQNLFDTDYVGSCGGNSIASGYCWAGYGRTAIATLSYRW